MARSGEVVGPESDMGDPGNRRAFDALREKDRSQRNGQCRACHRTRLQHSEQYTPSKMALFGATTLFPDLRERNHNFGMTAILNRGKDCQRRGGWPQ